MRWRGTYRCPEPELDGEGRGRRTKSKIIEKEKVISMYRYYKPRLDRGKRGGGGRKIIEEK